MDARAAAKAARDAAGQPLPAAGKKKKRKPREPRRDPHFSLQLTVDPTRVPVPSPAPPAPVLAAGLPQNSSMASVEDPADEETELAAPVGEGPAARCRPPLAAAPEAANVLLSERQYAVHVRKALQSGGHELDNIAKERRITREAAPAVLQAMEQHCPSPMDGAAAFKVLQTRLISQ